MATSTQTGKVTFLRIHETGTGYGPPDDRLQGEVVFKINAGNAAYAYGFELRHGDNSLTHQAMFQLLKDAMAASIPVHFDYEETPGKNNHRAFRVWIEKVPSQNTGANVHVSE